MPTPTRRLAYRDRWTWQLEEAVVSPVDTTNPATFPDQTTLISISTQWTQAEYTRLLSAILVGAELAFPEHAQQIYDDFMRCTNAMISDCEDVEDCIEDALVNNAEFRSAVSITVNQLGFGNPNHVDAQNTTILDRQPIGFADTEINEAFECNLDALWAGIRNGIVARLDDNGRDLLEDLAVIPNELARLSAFIDIVPVVGDLIEGIAVQLTSVIPALLDLYNSFSSEDELDIIACALFDLVCDECRYPTFKELFEYYMSRSPAGLAMENATLEQLATEIIDIVLGGGADEAAYFTTTTWSLWVLMVGSLFNGRNGTDSIIDDARIGEDPPDSDWQELCDGCGEPYRYKIYDFTVQDYSAHVDPLNGSGTDPTTRGVWIAGEGFQFTTVASLSAMRASFCMPFDPAHKIRAIGWDVETTGTIGTRSIVRRPTPSSSTGAAGINLDTENLGCEYQHFANGLLSLTNIRELSFHFATQLNTISYIKRMYIVFDADFAPHDSLPTVSATVPC